MRHTAYHIADLVEIFEEIPEHDYREKVELYEDNEETIQLLEDALYIRLRMLYIEALFFLEEYDKFLDQIEGDFAFIFDRNIQRVRGRDVLKWLMLLKGVAHYNRQEYHLAIEMFGQLSRMYPSQWRMRWFLFKALLYDHLARYPLQRTVAKLGSIFLIGELVFLRPQLTAAPQWLSYAFWGQILLLAVYISAFYASILMRSLWRMRSIVRKSTSITS